MSIVDDEDARNSSQEGQKSLHQRFVRETSHRCPRVFKADVFDKIKGTITDMIEKLEQDEGIQSVRIDGALFEQALHNAGCLKDAGVAQQLCCAQKEKDHDTDAAFNMITSYVCHIRCMLIAFGQLFVNLSCLWFQFGNSLHCRVIHHTFRAKTSLPLRHFILKTNMRG